jgi:predicted kinase
MPPPTLVILIGLPAAGKSTHYFAHFAATHVHVSKDLLPRGTRQEPLIDAALAAGKSVVVDNTNPSAAIRAPLIALGHRHGARIVAYFFEADVKTLLVRNRQREGKARVPNVAIFATKKKLAPPSYDEGFDEIHVIKATD